MDETAWLTGTGGLLAGTARMTGTCLLAETAQMAGTGLLAGTARMADTLRTPGTARMADTGFVPDDDEVTQRQCGLLSGPLSVCGIGSDGGDLL